MSLEALCSPRAGDLPLAHLSSCLAGLSSLLEHHWARAQLSAQPGLLVELCNVMHRQLLTQDSSSIQSTVLSIISLALTAATEDLATRKKNKLKEIFPANQSITDVPAEVAGLGEGGEEGHEPGVQRHRGVVLVQQAGLVPGQTQQIVRLDVGELETALSLDLPPSHHNIPHPVLTP